MDIIAFILLLAFVVACGWFIKWQDRKTVPPTPQKNINITVGPKDEEGFGRVYKDGEPTNLRLLLWDEEQVKRLQKIGKEIQEEQRNGKSENT